MIFSAVYPRSVGDPNAAADGAGAAAAAAAGSPNATYVHPTVEASNVTCFGTPKRYDALGQILGFFCAIWRRIDDFLLSWPFDHQLALGLFIASCVLLLLLIVLLCCCCCKVCGGGEEGKKKKRRRGPQNTREREYLDPRSAPALRSKQDPRTALDRIPLIGAFIQERVQPELYDAQQQNRIKESRLSGRGLDGDVDVKSGCGRIQFTLRRSGNKRTPDLKIGIVQVVELEAPPSFRSSMPDSYVTVMLLPVFKEVFETRVVKGTPDPEFMENFTFKSIRRLEERTLKIQVFLFDRGSVMEPPLGELSIEMSKFDLDRPVEEWHRLREPDPRSFEKFRRKSNCFGYLCLSLQYVHVMRRLTLVILEAKNLPKTPNVNVESDDDWITTTIDPMVKVSLKLKDRKVDKKKTTVKKMTACPYYNEILTFEVSPEHIQRVELAVTVVDSSLFVSDALGRILFGPHASGRAKQHWDDMLDAAGKPIAQWHVLANPKFKQRHSDTD